MKNPKMTFRSLNLLMILAVGFSLMPGCRGDDAEQAGGGGRYQASLDGVKIGGPLDFFGGPGAAAVFPMLDLWLDPGRHVLRLETLGQGERSAGHACTFGAVRLLERRPRVAAYGHDRDKDWRKSPVPLRLNSI